MGQTARDTAAGIRTRTEPGALHVTDLELEMGAEGPEGLRHKVDRGYHVYIQQILPLRSLKKNSAFLCTRKGTHNVESRDLLYISSHVVEIMACWYIQYHRLISILK